VSAPWLSVVVPVHDEEENLAPLHAELESAVAGLARGVEFIYVDDGSRDGSRAVLEELRRRDPRVRLLALDRNRGQTAALEAGFGAARGEVTATLDADRQNDPADLPRLLRELERADVVNGVRTQRRDSWVRRLSSRIGNGFRNRVTGEAVTDVGCSLRVMRTRFLREVKLYRGMHRFLPTLLALAGARVVEMPVGHRPRVAGRSKYGIGNRLFVGLADVLAVRWMKSRWLTYRVEEIRPEEARARAEAPGN
jgi:glycosyltransferase involved in cell wall biosynthesis